MPNITVIADTSCLIALSKIEAIELLKELYEEVYITKEIALEFGESLPEWVRIENVKNKKYQQLLDLYLDLGEASAIALALEKVDVLLILDDLKGRKEAEKLGFRKCIIPESNKKLLKDTYKLDIIGVQNISEAMRCLELKR